MKLVTYNLRLDVAKNNSQSTVYAKQGDKNTRAASITLCDRGKPVQLDSSMSVALYAIKADKKVVFNSCTIDNNTIKHEFSEQMFAAKGAVHCEVVVYGAGKQVLYSPRFYIYVTDRINEDEAIESSHEFTALEEALTTVAGLDEYIKASEEARNAAEENRTTAEGKREEAEATRGVAENSRAIADDRRTMAENARAEAEGSRVFAEDRRSIAESSRVIAESDRSTAEGKREEAEADRKAAEKQRHALYLEVGSAYNAAESERVTNENARKDAEINRVTIEDGRARAETEREAAEEKRTEAEGKRVTAENNRIKAEDNRTTAENNRVTAEGGRARAETARKTAEEKRTEAEAIRHTLYLEVGTAYNAAESERVTNENVRTVTESERVTAENNRTTAETTREAAENKRKDLYTDVKQAYETGGLKGDKGDVGEAGTDGEDGKSFTVKGMYATLEELISDYPRGEAGEAYLVGNEQQNSLYMWDSRSQTWLNAGSHKGDKGEKGDQGIQGIKGDTGGTGAQGLQGLKGDKGDKGDKGEKGDQGIQGIKGNTGTQGIRGLKGDKGDTGVGVPTGGKTGQALIKASSTDYDMMFDDVASGGIEDIIAGENIEINKKDPNKPIVTAMDNPMLKHIKIEGILNSDEFSGQSNMRIGLNAGNDLEGLGNTFLGFCAGESSRGADDCTYIGENAGANISSGWGNTYIGSGAGIEGHGKFNTFIGMQAGKFVRDASNCVVIGAAAGTAFEGDATVAIGVGALEYHSLANASVYIGTQSGAESPDSIAINQIAIGNYARCTANNQIMLGNFDVTQLVCNVTSISSLSDKRVKEYYHPADLQLCLDTVMALPTYRYKYEDYTGTHLDGEVTGFLADDVEKVFPKTVHVNDRYFPVLDDNGEPVMETYTDDEGNEQERPKTFLMEGVKEIAATDQLVATMWGAIQDIAAKVQLLMEQKKITEERLTETINAQTMKGQQAVTAVLEEKGEVL